MDLDKLKCAYRGHLCAYLTKVLSCGHHVCITCVPPSWSTDVIECRLCGELNRLDLRRTDDTNKLKSEIIKRTNDLAVDMKKNLEQDSLRVESRLGNAEERIEKEFEYSVDELEIRIESVKIEFDNLCEKLNKELDGIESALISISRIQNEELLETYDRITSKKSNRKLTIDESEELLKEYAAKVKLLDNTVDFSLSSKQIKAVRIGRIFSIDLRTRLKNAECEEIKISDEPWDICVIQGGNYLLTANYFQSSLTLYDSKFQVNRVIDIIGNLSFKPLSIATNSVDRIYISDFMNNRIIMCNYEFELLANVGEYGNNYRQFNGASGLAYYQNYVYACDYYNERIQMLTSNLRFEKSFLLYLTPFYIKVVNGIAAIKSDIDDYLYFYDLPHFSLRSKYEQHEGAICVYNDLLYQFDYLNMKILCYDELGTFNDEIKVNEDFWDVNYDDWTCLTQFGNKLLLCPGSALSIFII